MSYVLKQKQDMFFLFFSIQNIKSNCHIIFLNLFPIIIFWWKMYSLPVIFICNRFNTSYSLRIVFYFFKISCECYSVLKTFVIIFIDGIYWCFFALYRIRRIYIWSTTIRIYFMTFIIHKMNKIKDKMTNFYLFQIILISNFK